MAIMRISEYLGRENRVRTAAPQEEEGLARLRAES